MQHVKEHRAPTRYSLEPGELKELARLMKSRGGINDKQVRDQARRLGCATKPIYILASRIGLPVKTHEGSPRKNGESGKKPTARERAEQHFIQPSPQESPIVAGPEDLEITDAPLSEEDFDAAVDMLAKEEERINALHREHAEELRRREEAFQTHIAEMEARIEQEKDRVRQAIQQTRQLRLDTRKDRELLEDLKSRLHSAGRTAEREKKEAEKAREITLSHKKELLESMAREQALLDALTKSEADLAACREKSAKT